MSRVEQYLAVGRWLIAVHAPLLLTHRRPDGDALGSCAALARVLAMCGKRPTVGLFEPFPERYDSLRNAASWVELTDGRITEEHDAIVILDTCAAAQLEPALTLLQNRDAPPMLVIDHHATRDAIATRPQDLRVIDSTAGAAALLVQEICEANGWKLEADAALACFIGISTDTGWFRFSNVDARLLAAASRLLDAGVNPSELHQQLFQSDPAPRIRLIGRMLAGLELRADGALVVLRIRREDHVIAGSDDGMTENLVNEGMRIGSAEAALLCCEQMDGSVRFNFRSKRRLDVAALARRFGGGGHARASGARHAGPWETAVLPVVVATEAALRSAEAQP